MGAADASTCSQPTDGRTDLFRILQQGDVLVQHPYDSFTTSVEAFVEQAAHDPRVLAIKQTIYRTAGTDSAIVRLHSSARRARASRSSRSWSSRRASTSRPTSNGRGCWKKRASTWCTASSG